MDAFELHKKHNCTIQVEKLKDNRGCKISFPDNKINGLKAKDYVYLLIKEGIEIYENSKQVLDIKCPSYTKRLVVLTDFFLSSQKYNINTEISEFFDEEGEEINDVQTIDMLTISEEQEKDEVKLSEIYYDVLNGVDCTKIAKKKGVYEGYKVLKDLLEKREV